MMLHRLKLKVVYGDVLSKDKTAKRLKMRVILIAGFAVFVPFLAITYMLWTETRVGKRQAAHYRAFIRVLLCARRALCLCQRFRQTP